MDIARYIADLLKENKEVSVPGMGSFYIKRQPASFDNESNTFFPPKKELGFKTEESDPSLLINCITDVKNISEPSAKYFAENFGSEIKNRLETEGKVDIHPLGKFEQVSGEWIFQPSQEFSFTDYYRLPPVKELEWTASKEEIAKLKTEPQPAAIPTPEIQEENENTALTEEQLFIDTDPEINEAVPGEEIPIKKRKTWPAVLVIVNALIIIGAVVYISNPALLDFLLKPNTSAPVNKQVIPVSQEKNMEDSEAKADSIMQELHAQGFHDVEKIQDTTISNVEITAKTDTIQAQSPLRIEIIGASLPSRKEAENYIRQMKARGIDAKIVEEKKGRLIKVSLGSFTDKAKADAELHRIRREITKEAWPLTIKN